MTDDINVKFGADIGGLQSGVQSAASTINGFGASVASSAQNASAGIDSLTAAVNKAGSSSDSAFGKMVAAVAAVPAIVSAALGTVTAAAVSVGSAAQASADQLNAPVEAISRFAPVATAAGLSLQDFSNKFAVMSDNLRKGDTATQNAVKALHIDPKALGAEPAEQQIQTLMTALAGLRDNFQKSAAATALFGSSAEGIIAAASRATSSLGPLATEADRAGTRIGPELSAKIAGTRGILDQIGANFREAAEAVQGLAITVYNELKPAIDYFLQGFSNSVASIAKWIEGVNDATKAGGGLHGALVTAREVLLDVAAAMSAFTTMATEDFTSLGPIVFKIFEEIRTVGISIWGDIGGTVQRFFAALEASATESIRRVILGFQSLGSAAQAAFSFNMEGVKSSLADLGSAGERAAAQTNAAWSKVLPPGASANIDAAKDDFINLGKQGAEIASHLTANYAKAYADIQQQFQKPITAPEVKKPSAGNLPGTANADSDAIRAAMATSEGEVQAAQQTYKQKQQLLDSELKMHQISESQMLQSSKDALQDELQDEMDAYNRELATDGLKASAKQTILNKMAAAQAEYDLKIQKLDQDAAEKSAQTWQQAFSTINSAFTSQINGLLTGTTKFRDAFRNVLTTLTEDVIKFCVEWAMKQAETVALNIAGFNAQTIAGITGANAVSAAQAGSAMAGIASTLAAVGKQIAASAGAAGAGVTAFLAPIMGPAAVGVGASTEAEVFSMAAVGGSIYDTGAWQLPSDQIAGLHKGEMVIPQRGGVADEFRSFMSKGGFGGGDTHYHSHTWNMPINGGGNTKDTQAAVKTAIKQIFHSNGLAGFKPRFS